jgi:hypothetical protein
MTLVPVVQVKNIKNAVVPKDSLKATDTYSMNLKLITCLILGLMLPLSVTADIYKYTDAEGRIYLTDEPMYGHYRLLQRISTNGRVVKPARSGKSKVNYSALEQNRQRFSSLIEEVAQETLLRPELLHAVIRAESAYDPDAVSVKGAVGLMQLMPATAERYGVSDRNNPQQNVRGGANYLKDLLIMFEFDLKLAIAAYNAGENAVIRSGNKIPNYKETRNYVAKVLKFYRQNRFGNS